MELIPRPEHPDPQRMRENWRNLNGIWEFEMDPANSGFERGFVEKEHFSKEIFVPFCPESRLSGIEYTDFLEAVWYKKHIELSEEELRGAVLLHFGAVDYETAVFVNGREAGRHSGGYSSFFLDITPYAVAGNNVFTVQAVDRTRSHLQPTGKQSERFFSYGCSYTRTTGIWQTVWLEFVPKKRIISFRIVPDTDTCSVQLSVSTNAPGNLKAECFYKGSPMGEKNMFISGREACFEIALKEKHLWEVGCGRLYDVKLTFEEDTVNSYFGLRNICFDGMRFLLNGRSVFQRLVLDQGFYPDGIYTAPDEEALQKDIALSQQLGFNGARLHEKVFEPRFLYHCDKAGYLVWGEYPNWGVDISRPEALHIVAKEWLEVLARDRNHPSIIGWCPFNETWDIEGRKQFDATLSCIYDITKAADPTRPCIDASGNYHVKTDVFCLHDYRQEPESLRQAYEKLSTEGTPEDRFSSRQKYHGEPVMISEYGGIGWNVDQTGWGYGTAPKSEKEFLDRFAGLTRALMDNPKLFGLCYTQLYDVEQEMNGLYTYQREPKFSIEAIAAVLTKPAAIEEE